MYYFFSAVMRKKKVAVINYFVTILLLPLKFYEIRVFQLPPLHKWHLKLQKIKIN